MQQAISYRDKDGFVFVNDNEVFRLVFGSYEKEYDHLMQSGLYQKLVDAELLIPHTEGVLSAEQKNRYHKIITPKVIPCISLPYEWSATQWKEVVASLLMINRMAMEFGMILKDATPFNFTFYRGKCIFFDTLSFAFYKDGTPWIAYRQFCETMLGPLSLMHFTDTNWGKLMASSINGWELPFISKNLPARTYFSSTILLHIHWHSKYRNTGKQGLLKKRSFTRQQLLVLWDMLHSSVTKWKTGRQQQTWSTYYDSNIESETYLSDKTDLVAKWLTEINPDRVVDLGANNGRFSLLASLYANDVVAIESDHACIDELYRYCKQKKIVNITTILADIAEPTPGVGWNNAERASLFNRLNSDMVMALALLHHLCISRNVPLAFIAQLLAGITEKYAIVEFVSRADPKIQLMLANREDIFDDYTEENFITAFEEHFQLIKSHQCCLPNRKIFLWRKKG